MKAAPSQFWNELDFIMAFEEGQLSDEEVAEGFQHLIDNGHAWSLQGFYGRTAVALMLDGACKATTPTAKAILERESGRRMLTRAVGL